MLMLISPAKTLDFEEFQSPAPNTEPGWMKKTESLVRTLRKLKAPQLMELMDISEKLADLNVARYKSWTPDLEQGELKQASLAFKGEVYLGLEAWTFSKEDFDFANQHLRILSGMYGLLKPTDLIRPYRLEMGTRLKTTKGENLYDFWRAELTKAVSKHVQKDEPILVLASAEYAKAVETKKLKNPVYEFTFLEFMNGNYKPVQFYLKKARGLMAKYVIQNRITDIEAVKGFNLDGYAFSPNESTQNHLVFKRG